MTIYLSGNVNEVVSFLEDNGGDPRNVGEDYIEAYVPVTLLGQVSEQPGVIRVREIVPPQPVQTIQRIIGHGPAAHGSPAWNQAGIQRPGRQGGDNRPRLQGLDQSYGDRAAGNGGQARCYTDIGVFTQEPGRLRGSPEPVPERFDPPGMS